MKKMIVMLVIGVLSLGILIGCDDRIEDRVVAEQYRGTWIFQDADSPELNFTLTENIFSFPEDPIAAYTNGNKLFLRFNHDFEEAGTFSDNSTFCYTYSSNNRNYKKE